VHKGVEGGSLQLVMVALCCLRCAKGGFHSNASDLNTTQSASSPASHFSLAIVDNELLLHDVDRKSFQALRRLLNTIECFCSMDERKY